MAPTATTGAAPAAFTRLSTLTIEGQKRNVARARSFVNGILGPRHPAADAAVLLVSEVVTNAVLHTDSGAAGGSVTVTVSEAGDWLRIEVADAGSDHSVPEGRSKRY